MSPPTPPYYAVIFTARRTESDEEGYAEAAARMEELAENQRGFLGIETARDPVSGWGVTVSYWESEADIAAWRNHAEHVEVQRSGRARWYDAFHLRVARVERERSWSK